MGGRCCERGLESCALGVAKVLWLGSVGDSDSMRFPLQ